MAEETENQQQEERSGEGGGGTSTAVKAAAAAAATSVAAIAAKKALSNRGDSNGGSGSQHGDMGSMLNSALSGGWDAAKDALIPAAEDAAGAIGEWLAENAPDVVTERIVPRFIESFNEASGGS